MASLSRQTKLTSYRCLAVKFFNQRPVEGHPHRKPKQAVILGQTQTEPREQPAVYLVFFLWAARGSYSL